MNPATDKSESFMAMSAKSLLTRHNLPMDAATLSNGLILAGLLERKTYLSTTGSGEVKHFLAFTGAGESFGKNAQSGWHEIKTEPKFYKDKFAIAYLYAANAILKHGQDMFGQTS